MAKRVQSAARGEQGAAPSGRPCNLANALSVLGEKYALLIIREVFLGVRRFAALAQNTGAPRDVLAARLRLLVEHGILRKQLYHERPPRYEYRLTPAGKELRSALLVLRDWGDRFTPEEGGSPVTFGHSCGEQLATAVVCRHCGTEVHPADLTPHVHTLGWTLTGPTTEAS